MQKKLACDIPYYLGQSDTNYIFSGMLKFSNIISSKSNNILKDNSENLGILHLLKWKFQNELVIWWTYVEMVKVLWYFMIGLVSPFFNHFENSHTTSMKKLVKYIWWENCTKRCKKLAWYFIIGIVFPFLNYCKNSHTMNKYVPHL